MDSIRLDTNTLQSYVLLSSSQIQKISQIFDVYDRDGISKSVQLIVDEYIKTHDKADVDQLKANVTWEDFTNKFNEGWFNK